MSKVGKDVIVNPDLLLNNRFLSQLFLTKRFLNREDNEKVKYCCTYLFGSVFVLSNTASTIAPPNSPRLISGLPKVTSSA